VSTINYVYDNANRLTDVDGVTYVYDNNGNLLNDGVNAYEYDSANRLVSFTNATTTVTYRYNGLGDRLQETVNGITTTFTMDLNTGLTQALSDGTNTYIYGLGRIAQVNTTTEYFLGDALGSVRQLTDASGEITYNRAYDPYGVVTSTLGDSQSTYGYTGEHWRDSTQLLYLRSRYYASGTGRFISRDTWNGNANSPMSFNRWNYTYSNPINLTDPSGNFPVECLESGDYKECIREWMSDNCPGSNNNYSESKQIEYIESFGIDLEPEEKWTGMWLTNLRKALFNDIGGANLPFWLNGKRAKMVIASQGTCNATGGAYGGCTPGTTIYFWVNGATANPVINMLHEIGHLVDNLSDTGNDFTNRLRTQEFTLNDMYWGGWNGSAYKSIPHSGRYDIRRVALINDTYEGQDAWQQRGGTPHWEDWADIFSNSMIDNINTSEPGLQINLFFKSMEKYAKSR
jgi:RHS repeat-associated protein